MRGDVVHYESNAFSDFSSFDIELSGPVGVWTVSPPLPTPIPAALPLFATGLGALGLIGWRRKRKQSA